MEEKKQELLNEVIGQQGPPDGTVIVSLVEGDFDDETIDALVETLTDVGDIILVRYCKKCLC